MKKFGWDQVPIKFGGKIPVKKEYIYASISIILWGSTAAITKVLLNNLSSIHILFISSFFAFLFLLIVNIAKNNMRELKKYKLVDYIKMILIGSLGMFFYNLFLYLGIANLLAQEAFIINYLWPIMIIIFSCIILKEKMTYQKGQAIVLSFIGVVVLVTKGNIFYTNLTSIKGVIFSILAAVCYGLFSVLNKREKYNKYLSTMIAYFVSFVISFIYVLVTGSTFKINNIQFIGLLWMGVFASAVAYTSWALALDKGDTAKISNLAYITPFLSLVFTHFILHEEISLYSIIGLMLIVVGILIQLKKV